MRRRTGVATLQAALAAPRVEETEREVARQAAQVVRSVAAGVGKGAMHLREAPPAVVPGQATEVRRLPAEVEVAARALRWGDRSVPAAASSAVVTEAPSSEAVVWVAPCPQAVPSAAEERRPVPAVPPVREEAVKPARANPALGRVVSRAAPPGRAGPERAEPSSSPACLPDRPTSHSTVARKSARTVSPGTGSWSAQPTDEG